MTDSKQSTRRKSLFSQKGDEAKAQAQRQLLHETLIAESWNLTRTAHALELPGPSHVLRAIAALGLREEYEKARGWVKTPI